METLKNYLDNMFAGFSKTAEILKLKEDLANGMEDKYNELKISGKNENEAIAIVISEFGNIEELINEMHISSPAEANSSTGNIITMQDAQNMLSDKKKYGGLVAIGVWLCIMGAAIFLLLQGYVSTRIGIIAEMNLLDGKEEFMETLCFIPLLLFITIAVALFIYSGTHLEKYEQLLKSNFSLDYGVSAYIRELKTGYQPKHTLGIVVGVVLCILSGLIFLLIGALASASYYHEDFISGIALFVTLFINAIAVFIFIRVGLKMETYDALLKEGDFAKTKKENKIVSLVAAIVWPVATAIYLLWSFLTNDWHITWLVWPITAVLFGAFAAVCNILTEKS